MKLQHGTQTHTALVASLAYVATIIHSDACNKINKFIKDGL